MRKAKRIGLSIAAALIAVTVVTAVSHFLMHDAIRSTIAPMIGAVVFFTVLSLSRPK